MEFEIINDQFNGVKVLKNSAGKFGLQEIIDGEEMEPEFRWRTLELAEKAAQSISDENDRIKKYAESFK